MLQIPDTAPHTQEEFDYLISATVANSQEEYENAVEAAKEKAIAQWEAMVAARPMTLAENEDSAKLAETLEQEKKVAIQQAIAAVPPPLTLEQVEKTYRVYKQMFEQPNIQPMLSMPVTPLVLGVYDAVYKVSDSYWDVAQAKWVAYHSSAFIIELGGPQTVENLREALLHYAKRDPRIHLGPEIMTEAELFESLRKERNTRLEEYDRKIAQLDRRIRLNPDVELYSYEREAWDVYAVALCNMPDEEGAPWDGGGPETPWPTKPGTN